MKLWRLSWDIGMKQKLDKDKNFQRTFKCYILKIEKLEDSIF